MVECMTHLTLDTFTRETRCKLDAKDLAPRKRAIIRRRPVLTCPERR
jgi:hypothetical protein